MTSQKTAPLLAVIITALVPMFAVGCSSEKREPAARTHLTEVTQPRAAVSEALMIALGQAKNFHGRADVYLKNGDIERAIVEVERVLAIRFPTNAPEGEDVILDARARLGNLVLGRGDLKRAREIIDRGIESATRDSFFLANLHTVRGELIDAQADTLAASDADGAKRLRLEAIRDFDRSIAINSELQKKLMSEDGE